MRLAHALTVGGVATLALVWLLVTMGDHAPPARRHLPIQRVEVPFEVPEGTEPPAQEPPVEAPTPKPQEPKTVAIVAPAATIADRMIVAPGEDLAEAWARTVEAALSTEERKALDRHLGRFVRAPSGAGTAVVASGDGAAQVTVLPKADADGAEQRRIEQLERLRQRKAVELLDHIDAGLAWLALHQGADGRITDASAIARCAELGHKPSCARGSDATADTAATALSVIALLDFRDQDRLGVFEPTLARAVSWLRSQQRPDGAFPGKPFYSAAMALLALGQAASSTGSGELRDVVSLGLVHLAAQQGRDGGYRYRTGDPGDLSVTAWVAQAVEAARHAKAEIPPEMEEGLARFLESAWLGEYRFSYLVGERERTSLDPAGILAALIVWKEPRPDTIESWRRLLVAPPPTRIYSLYYGVRVAIALEHGLPDNWRRAVLDLAAKQISSGTAAGAFPKNELAVGTVIETCFSVLTLEHALHDR